MSREAEEDEEYEHGATGNHSETKFQKNPLKIPRYACGVRQCAYVPPYYPALTPNNPLLGLGKKKLLTSRLSRGTG